MHVRQGAYEFKALCSLISHTCYLGHGEATGLTRLTLVIYVQRNRVYNEPLTEYYSNKWNIRCSAGCLASRAMMSMESW